MYKATLGLCKDQEGESFFLGLHACHINLVTLQPSLPQSKGTQSRASELKTTYPRLPLSSHVYPPPLLVSTLMI